MMRTVWILMMAMLFPLAAWAGAEEDFQLPRDWSLALPIDGEVKAEWVAPPIREAMIRRSRIHQVYFQMDPRARVWMVVNGQGITDLSSGVSFTVGHPVRDLVFPKDGSFFILTDTTLGFIPRFDVAKIDVQSPVLPYQPVARLPVEQGRAVLDGQGNIFVYGYENESKSYAVFALGKDFGSWQKIFSSPEKIAGVGIQGRVFYIAAGRNIFRMTLGEAAAPLVLTHPLDVITGVVYVDGAGLFYATPNGVGVVSGLGLEFLKCPAAQIRAGDNALFVFLPDSLGVLKIDHVRGLIRSRIDNKE